MSHRLILASASPRRVELLAQIGVSCAAMPADIDETPREGERASELVERLAAKKAETIAANHPGNLVLAADTVVYLPNESTDLIFGKPVDERDAHRMLETLSNKEHRVSTGLALYDGGEIRRQVVTTKVTFAEISPASRAAYWDSGEPIGKAGAYAIQGLGARFVVEIKGSYSRVVGLPLYETSAWLTQAGLIH